VIDSQWVSCHTAITSVIISQLYIFLQSARVLQQQSLQALPQVFCALGCQELEELGEIFLRGERGTAREKLVDVSLR
jgi:hypothetical protein